MDLNAFKVERDPQSPNYIGYSYTDHDRKEIDYKRGNHHGKPGVVPTATALQTSSKPMNEPDLHSEDDPGPAPKTYTQEQVDQMLKLASAGINITVERVEGKEGKPEKEEEKHDSPRSLRATPYVAPPSISNDMMKVEMGKSIILSSL